MNKEAKRGVPFPNGFERDEAKLLGPFPSWGAWKHVIEKRFGIDFKNSHRPAENLLHQFYVIRRLHQKAGQIDKEEIMEFWQWAEEEMPGFEEKYSVVIDFIVNKTPIRER